MYPVLIPSHNPFRTLHLLIPPCLFLLCLHYASRVDYFGKLDLIAVPMRLQLCLLHSDSLASAAPVLAWKHDYLWWW